MELHLIAALARNRVIGRDQALPWKLAGDLPRFKALTMGHPVVMGRKTFASIGKPLPGRLNIVLSRSAPASAGPNSPIWVRSWPEALAQLSDRDRAFVIGGGEIYALALAQATHLNLTEVDAEVDGDAWFPAFDRGQWREVFRQAHPAQGGQPAFAFVDYVRADRPIPPD